MEWPIVWPIRSGGCTGVSANKQSPEVIKVVNGWLRNCTRGKNCTVFTHLKWTHSFPFSARISTCRLPLIWDREQRCMGDLQTLQGQSALLGTVGKNKRGDKWAASLLWPSGKRGREWDKCSPNGSPPERPRTNESINSRGRFRAVHIAVVWEIEVASTAK